MQRVHRLLRQTGFHVFAFCLFTFVLIWPILAIPGHRALAKFFAYLFLAWAIMIVMLFVLSNHLDHDRPDANTDSPEGPSRV
jgi:hypothetical protein